MKREILTAVLILGSVAGSWGQTDGDGRLVKTEASVTGGSTNSYAILGATPQQEELVRAQIQVMQPEVLPLRIIFAPHWKYVETTRNFQLHVPAGFTSAMFTHLPSRSVFIDSDRYVSDDSLGYWVAHELGHLAANSASESAADKAAREYRRRLKDARKRDVHYCSPEIRQGPIRDCGRLTVKPECLARSPVVGSSPFSPDRQR